MDKRTHPETGWVNVYSAGRFAGFRPSGTIPCLYDAVNRNQYRTTLQNYSFFPNYEQNTEKKYIDMTEQNTAAARRKTQLNLVVGINGTGKTTFLRENVVKRGGKCLVVTPDDYEWRELPEVTTATEIYNLQHGARLVYRGPETLEMAIGSFYGGALILDDAMAYIGFQTSDTMRFLYIRRRQRGVDVYVVAHGLRQVPVQCFTFGSFLILFATTENFSSRKKELDDEIFRRILETQQELNRACRAGKRYECRMIKLDPAL